MHIFKRDELLDLYTANKEARAAHFERLLQQAAKASTALQGQAVHGLKEELQAYKDEPTMTLVTFAALRRCGPSAWEGLMTSTFPESEWTGLPSELALEKAISPAEAVLRSLREEAERHPVKYVRDSAQGKDRLEGPTNFDAWAEYGGRSLFIEAKFTSDISVDTTHCTNRNQIARCIDIGLQSVEDKVERFFFVMLTPDRYQKAPGSRLYYYKMLEYRRYPEMLAEDIPRLKESGKDIEFYRALGERIAFLSWEACAKAILSEPVWTPGERDWLTQFYRDRRCLLQYNESSEGTRGV
ncbi:hypothetical protein FE782_01860 [Paenibacillus antri]|uniref:Restriction endonuclease n=1 Tax=Paenibacillus antri TaxID=2582848 RepID=A0A5R9GPC8_9BACL|nr:hypothetical protein [Paenibacillus antri]TLS54115.1 hypothetical protein FE782_01860 [Paenibacillus antri]